MKPKAEKAAKINEWIDVKPVHCHKRLPENTLVEKVRFTSEDKTETEVLHRFVPSELKFFFDHEIDHLPGMLETCAMRQACLAVSHIIYDVPMDFITVMDNMSIKICNYGELNTPVYTKGKMEHVHKKKDRIIIDIKGVMMQGDYPLIKTEGRLVAMSPAFAARIRNKKTLDP